MLTDLGGISLADDVLVGPNVTIISVNHPLNPHKRHGVELNPVHIEENAWLGANATILPGVTVGKNAGCPCKYHCGWYTSTGHQTT